jgi:hypothetical protein
MPSVNHGNHVLIFHWRERMVLVMALVVLLQCIPSDSFSGHDGQRRHRFGTTQPGQRQQRPFVQSLLHQSDHFSRESLPMTAALLSRSVRHNLWSRTFDIRSTTALYSNQRDSNDDNDDDKPLLIIVADTVLDLATHPIPFPGSDNSMAIVFPAAALLLLIGGGSLLQAALTLIIFIALAAATRQVVFVTYDDDEEYDDEDKDSIENALDASLQVLLSDAACLATAVASVWLLTPAQLGASTESSFSPAVAVALLFGLISLAVGSKGNVFGSKSGTNTILRGQDDDADDDGVNPPAERRLLDMWDERLRNDERDD